METTVLPHEVEKYLRTNLGDEATRVAAELARLGSATDTVLAELLDARTSHIRRALYALHGVRVAEYREHRDKAKGWLTFVWSMDTAHAQRAVTEAVGANELEIRTELDALAAEPHYECSAHPTLLPMSSAVEHAFQCAECDGVLHEANLEGRIRELSRALAALTPRAS